ncbi:hypothetical protein V5O48_013904 [Marasmius crinis-equi]|uniref:Uncharacterized protein n=1 Tax=Marasmius crinis-equi TaxID=585013 RepID=A0ABR3EYU1_9AGAR
MAWAPELKITLCSIFLSAFVSGSLAVASRITGSNPTLSLALAVAAGSLVVLGGVLSVYALYLGRHSYSTLDDSEMGLVQPEVERGLTDGSLVAHQVADARE